jgi:hypothetical protein
MTNSGEISDGYHTFDELYTHRTVLFLALMSQMKDSAWWSYYHHDGTYYDDYIIVGINLTKQKTITYHISTKWIRRLINMKIQQLSSAPEWDGHTSRDVLIRLLEEIDPSKDLPPVKYYIGE